MPDTTKLAALLDAQERKDQEALDRAKKRAAGLAAKIARRQRDRLHARYAAVGVLLDTLGLLWLPMEALEPVFKRNAEELLAVPVDASQKDRV